MNTIKEIGLVVENGSNQLSLVSELFDDNGIRMIGFHVNTEEKKCRLRIVVNDPEKAVNVLNTAGYDLQVTDVIACELPDHPGGLNAILNALKSKNINMDCIYTLNPLGAFIWGRLDGGATLGELKAAVVDEYDVDPESAASDLLAFVQQLELAGAVRRS